MAPQAADELALEGAAGLLGRAPLLQAARKVGPCGGVAARLDEGDVVEQAVQAAVAQPVGHWDEADVLGAMQQVGALPAGPLGG